MQNRKRTLLTIASLTMAISGLGLLGGYSDWLKPTGSCYCQLEDIDIAKQYWALENHKPAGTPVSFAALVPTYLTAIPSCAQGGKYSVGNVGAEPTCSHGGRWHTRQFYLNFASHTLVVGRNVYFEGTSSNTPSGATVSHCDGDEPYLLDGVPRWPLLKNHRKVSVFGKLAEQISGNHTQRVILNPQWECRWTQFTAADACINHMRQIDGAQQQWAMEKHKLNSDTTRMRDLVPYIRGYSTLNQYPRCDSGGIYTLGTVAQSPRCTLHKKSLDDLLPQNH